MKTFFKIIVGWIIYILSFLFPRNKKVWVFMGWHHEGDREIFADNSKYLFLHVSKNREEYELREVIWLTKDKNLRDKLRKHDHRSYLKNETKGIFYALVAGYTIVDAYISFENWKYTGWTKIIELWHGAPMKKIGFQKRGYPMSPKWKARIISPSQFLKIHSLFVTSESQIQTHAEAFDIPENIIEVAEYPRNSAMAQSNIPEDEINIGVDMELLNILKGKKYDKHIIYTPTFRRGENKFKLERVLEFDKLSAWLVEKNYLLTIGLHPKDYKEVEGKSFKNIYFLGNSDSYPLFKHMDLLITDYSSVALDFLFADKPLLFYPYDLENYTKTEGFTVDYMNVTPGKKVYKFEDLFDSIEETLRDDMSRDARNRVKALYHPYSNKDASERLMEKILRK
jgi:CDP-glycerol glycerophosphotransferase (TagB/SpsB family)